MMNIFFSPAAKPIDTVRGNLEKVVRDGLSLYNIDDKTLKYLTRKIRNFYFGNREINDDVLEDIVNVCTCVILSNLDLELGS